MGRPGITREQVFEAAGAIADEGGGPHGDGGPQASGGRQPEQHHQMLRPA